ncbi:ATP-binding protein [Algoriphagus yeomjeoni]|uniref:Putative DNA-binding protein n=1 Tax=Algoriphagus yeomjeoni TaxID=291403 RepID=A0A327PA50_9BACT|nr:ATP-binding protein [Algoriphagus yeomjeoni]RAI86726.1 putative DNA-binding protein [Algoriphagus yeomjeoni]
MNYSQIYFQKDLDVLTAEDLIYFFSTPQKETQFLEFKSSRERNPNKVFSNTLKPGICSFLNSEGGILIYGAPKENKKNPDNPFQGEIEPYENGFLGEHDTIIRKISGGIVPMPVGVRLKEVEFPDGFVGVFEIQQSQTKPHQTDNVYQIRIDGQKTPAPHYLIEAMMKRITFPDIKAYLKIDSAIHQKENTFIFFNVYLINFSPFQNGKKIRIRIGVAGSVFLLKAPEFDIKKRRKSLDFEEFQTVTLGEPIQISHQMITSLRALQEEPKIEIIITFHGENIPARLTSYILDASNLMNAESLSQKSSLKLEVNNMFFSDYQNSIGVSHEEALKKSLGIDF